MTPHLAQAQLVNLTDATQFEGKYSVFSCCVLRCK
jgi:hypothetical protein